MTDRVQQLLARLNRAPKVVAADLDETEIDWLEANGYTVHKVTYGTKLTFETKPLDTGYEIGVKHV